MLKATGICYRICPCPDHGLRHLLHMPSFCLSFRPLQYFPWCPRQSQPGACAAKIVIQQHQDDFSCGSKLVALDSCKLQTRFLSILDISFMLLLVLVLLTAKSRCKPPGCQLVIGRVNTGDPPCSRIRVGAELMAARTACLRKCVAKAP